MKIWLAFAPFIAFAAVERMAGTMPGLLAGAATSGLLIARDLVSGRAVRILEGGTVLLFAGLAAWAFATDAHWSIVGVRLRVDAGLLLIVLVTLVIRQPFTLQYAREQVPEALWNTPQFLHTNTVITTAWAGAFAVMVAADLLMLYRPDVPIRFGIIVTVLALIAAVKFTAWYPDKARQAA